MRQIAPPRDRSPCIDAAFTFEEPYTSAYHPRSSLASLGGGIRPVWTLPIPRAVWRWPGDFDRVRFDKAAGFKFDCTDCIEQIVHYKIVDGRLFATKTAKPQDYWRSVVEEMLNVVLYMFPMPDMEFLVFLGDGCTAAPIIQWNVCFKHGHPGFTMPTYNVWGRSMGRNQLAAYHMCLAERYPTHNRIPQAVWRGSNTRGNGQSVADAMRTKLHMLTRNNSDVLNAKITDLVPGDTADASVRTLINDMGNKMSMEDYNKYCVIIDVDGNGWSDRFGTALIHYPTPVLKVASNASAWFEHLYAPGVAIEQFSPDMSDLMPIVRRMIADCKKDGSHSQGQRLARNMRATTRALMDHIGIIEGFAYNLVTYKSLTPWAFDPNVEEFDEVDATCCKHSRLPPTFMNAVSRRLVDGRVPATA